MGQRERVKASLLGRCSLQKHCQIKLGFKFSKSQGAQWMCSIPNYRNWEQMLLETSHFKGWGMLCRLVGHMAV